MGWIKTKKPSHATVPLKFKKKWRNLKNSIYVLVVGGQVRPAEHCQPGGAPLEHTGQVPCPEVRGNHPGMFPLLDIEQDTPGTAAPPFPL
jgi:hypothetical protein